jgi:hypothetical protein
MYYKFNENNSNYGKKHGDNHTWWYTHSHNSFNTR